MSQAWEWRCRGETDGRRCNKLLGKFEDLRRGSVMCPRCKTINRAVWPDGVPTEQVTQLLRTGAR